MNLNKKYNHLLYDHEGRHSILPKMAIDNIDIGTVMRAKWNKECCSIVNVEGDIVVYESLSGFKSISYPDGFFRDSIYVILECFDFVI